MSEKIIKNELNKDEEVVVTADDSSLIISVGKPVKTKSRKR